jgi:hypothetical protein
MMLLNKYELVGDWSVSAMLMKFCSREGEEVY